MKQTVIELLPWLHMSSMMGDCDMRCPNEETKLLWIIHQQKLVVNANWYDDAKAAIMLL